MRRGWEVTYYDGTVIREGAMDWKKVKKNQIHTLSLLYDGRRWDLYDKEAYFIKNRASAVPGVAESLRIESRTIGYYDGADKVAYTVDEHTGKFKVEIL